MGSPPAAASHSDRRWAVLIQIVAQQVVVTRNEEIGGPTP
jgi:hypothetical protein